jgi:CHAT domain-containing protein
LLLFVSLSSAGRQIPADTIPQRPDSTRQPQPDSVKQQPGADTNGVQPVPGADTLSKTIKASVRDTALRVLKDSLADSLLLLPPVNKMVNYKDSIAHYLQQLRATRDSSFLQQVFFFVEQQKIALISDSARRAATHAITMAQLQQKVIPPNSAILSYHVQDRLLLAFVVTRKAFHYFTAPLSDTFFTEVRNLYMNLQQVDGINNKTFSRQGRYLYDRLILPVQELLSCENLMIIPGDTLRNIPFELLQDRGGDYLLHQYSMQYNDACSLLQPGAQQQPPGVVTAMWRGDDSATAFIMRRFRHYIQQEFSMVQALQLARLDYVKRNDIEARFKTPAYWANLRLTGPFQRVQGVAAWWSYVLPGALLLIALILMIGFRRSVRRRAY